MKLEERLSKWAERPEDEDDDTDYGLIIDDSVTAARPAPPKFIKAGSCSQLPARTALLSPPRLLTTANIRPLDRPSNAAAARPPRPAARASLSARDVLHRFSEPADDDDNYDDMVLPEDEEMLDRQLAEWRTPCRRPPSWPNNALADEVTMSGATAVEPEAPGTKPAAAAAAHAGASPKDTPTTTLGPAASRRHALAATLPPILAASSSAAALATTGPLSPLCRASLRSPYQPMLITSAQHPAEPVVLGRMRYDPARRVWLGNDDEAARLAGAIAESEYQLRAEHPIDTTKLAYKISQRSGGRGLGDPDAMAVDPASPSCASPASPQFFLQAAAASNNRRRL
ncbi:hypothetical protein H4R19_004015, partial [Coemansia spiralis]